jgi:hypothetical protein
VKWVAALLILATFAAAPDAQAAHDTDRAPRPATEKTVRVLLPFYGFTIGNAETFTSSIGVSGGLRLAALWSLEAGFALQGSTDTLLFARFGVTPTLVDVGDVDGGWTVDLGPWLGYRYDAVSTAALHNERATDHVHSMIEHLGLEITRWWPDQSGLDILLLGGLVLPFARSQDEPLARSGNDADVFHHALDLRIEIGAAF